MKILIAGGAGYIGSVLAPALAELGHEVTVVDLMWFGNHLPPTVVSIQKELFDLEQDDIKGYDQVIFLAGLSNDPMAEYSPRDNFIYNAALPAYLAYLAKKTGVKRFIYAGSCSVYGYTHDKVFTEEDPTVSNYPYGISKLQGESAAMQMMDSDYSVICLRQGTLSGYSPRMRLDLAVNTMFKTALQKKEIILNNPAIRRPILCIHDMVDAYSKAVACPHEISGIFNVASQNYTVGEIGELVHSMVEKEFGEKIVLTKKNIPDYRNYIVSTDKAKKILGFNPKQGVEDVVKNLIANLNKFSDFSNPNFYNIEVFKKIKSDNLFIRQQK